MTLENDYLKAIHDELKMQGAQMLAYQRRQLEQARKTPGITKIYSFNLLNPVSPTPVALQIVEKNDSRDSVALTNAAGDDCLVSEKWFDPTTILQYFSDLSLSVGSLAYNSAVPIGLLVKGNSLSFDGVNGIWAYALGSNLGTPVATLISIADSIYETKRVKLDKITEYNAQELHPLEQGGMRAIN